MRRPEMDSQAGGRSTRPSVALGGGHGAVKPDSRVWDAGVGQQTPECGLQGFVLSERVQGSDRVAASPHGRHRIVSATAWSRVSTGAGPALAFARARTPRRRARRGHLERR
jgi:hypothetical protein